MEHYKNMDKNLSTDPNSGNNHPLQEAFVQEHNPDLMTILLEKRLNTLRTLISRLKKDLAGAPEGRLRISQQKDYLLHLLKAAETELLHLENARKNYDPDALVNAYLSLSPARRELVRPYIQPKEELIRNCLAYRYEPKPFSAADPEIFTEKGERVRSKS